MAVARGVARPGPADEAPPVAPVRRSTGKRVELCCRDCGYGVVVESPPSACPMCRGAAWEHQPWRPFSRLPEFEAQP